MAVPYSIRGGENAQGQSCDEEQHPVVYNDFESDTNW